MAPPFWRRRRRRSWFFVPELLHSLGDGLCGGADELGGLDSCLPRGMVRLGFGRRLLAMAGCGYTGVVGEEAALTS